MILKNLLCMVVFRTSILPCLNFWSYSLYFELLDVKVAYIFAWLDIGGLYFWLNSYYGGLSWYTDAKELAILNLQKL